MSLQRRLSARVEPLRQWLKGLATTPLQAPLGLGVLAMVGLTHLGGMVAAVWGLPWLFLVSAVLGVLTDQLAERMQWLCLLFERCWLGLVARSMIREFSLVVLLARMGFPDRDTLLVAALTFIVIVVRSAMIAAEWQSTQRQMPKIATRNLHLDAIEESAPVPAVPMSRIALAACVPVLVAAATVPFGLVWPYLVAASLFSVGALGWTIWRLASMVQHRRKVDRTSTMLQAADEVARLRPQAVLYFSGEADAIYQVNVWLRVMEQLGVPVIILLRERANLPLVAPTTLPIVCIPGAADLMDFRLPTVRVAFYVAHVGKNIHLMREPRIKHVFIGHGESDKVASINPITKGFDEVWVAGRVSRERWAAAKVGVRDDAIVEVGRPQLAGIHEGGGMPTERPISVLYAPTWEGWTLDPFACSLVTMGPSLVGWLLKQPNVRVIYKPHPFTGKVSAAARRANAQVISMIEDDPRAGSLSGTGAAAWAAAEAQHLVISRTEPDLYECFNRTDLLIGDVSSVVPDFLSTGKPYIIPNPAGRDHAEIRSALASARGAYLLDPKSEGWADVFADATGPDSLRPDRQALQLALLGPRYDDPVEPWRVALHDLIDRANLEWPDAEREASRPLDD